MVECDELRVKAVASIAAVENPSHEFGNNSSNSREEGELSASDDDELPAASASQFNTTPAAQEEAVPVASLNKVAEGRWVSAGNPKSFVDIPSRISAHPNYQKSIEKNRAPFVPFVISFSDDDSGSDSEEFRQSKASETKGKALGVDGNRRPPASSISNSQTLRKSTNNEGRVMPRKVSLSRTFVSSISKINGANSRNGERSLIAQKSHDFNTPNKRLVGWECGGNPKMHLNSSKLQDLRQQIAIRENEIKLKSAQQHRETVSGSYRNYTITDSDNDAGRKRRATSADFVPREQRDPEKKRIKHSEPHQNRLISDVPSDRSLLEDGGQQRTNEHSCRDKVTPLGRMHTRAAQQNKQDDTRGLLSSGNANTSVNGCEGADVIGDGSKSNQNIKLVDPSFSSEQTERIVSSTAKNFLKKSSTMELKHSSDLNCHYTQISEKTTSGQSQTVGSKLHEVRSGEKASRPVSNDKNQACSLLVPAKDLETLDVSLNNSSLCNCLGTLSIAQDKNLDMQSLLDLEQLQDKELEEAQEHRLKCEIEEKNALKAYRNAQRALVEANARCSYLYRKREIFSAHLRSLMMENSSLFWSSGLHNCTGVGLYSSNKMPEDHAPQLPTSSHQMQAELNDYNQQSHNSNIQDANGALQTVSDQHADGHLASDPCSETDASTSEPHKDDRMADGVCSPSSNLNESADEDEETFPCDDKSVQAGLDCQRKEESYGQRANNINEATRKFSFDSSQDSLLLEATLRSQLFARLGAKTNSNKGSLIHNTESSHVTRVEHDVAVGQEERCFDKESFPAVEKRRHSGFGGTDVEEKIITELPLQINEGHVEHFSSNYASPTADPSDCYFSAEGYQLSRSVTVSCHNLRSTFGHLKVAEPVNLVGILSDINEEGNSVGSIEIQPSILKSNSVEGTSVNICARKVGCYNCHLAIDPSWPLCMFELRGKCNNDECPWQHVKDYSCGNMNLENSDCQVGSSNQRGKSYGETSTLRDNHCLGLAPPTYLVCLDMLKADFHPNGSVLARSVGRCWQKCFTSSLVLSSLLPSDSPTDEPFLHGTQARVEVNGNWNSQSLYFHSRSGKMSQLDQHLADDDQSLEMALLNLHQEVNKRKGRIEALKVLSRALEANLSSVVLWVVYLHIYYSNEKSIGKDDMFHYAVENVDGSYELWLMYINSRIQLEDRLAAYDTALLALCCHASASTSDSDTVHASACILDLFLQLVNCLCISGNSDKAIEKICRLFCSKKNSDQPHPLLLSSILQCLTLYDKCIFWLCCVYFTVYRKLPDAVVKQFECEKEISELEWPSAYLTIDEKQQANSLIEMAVDSLALYIDSRSLESESTLKTAHMFALNHIRCIAVLEGLECRTLLEKYTKLYPSCLELILMSARMGVGHFADTSFVGFEEALGNWPEEVPGVQCIWNQYAECVLQNGRFDFAKELMNRWFLSVCRVQNSPSKVDSASAFNSDAWVSNLSGTDVVFGLLNLSLHKLLQKDPIEACLAIDRALKSAASEDYMYCVREHAMFLLSNGSHFEDTSSVLDILKGYLVDPRAFPASRPLSRKFIQSIKKPRVRQLVSNIWSVVSSDFSLINLVLEVCFGPSLLPQTFSKLKDLVDFVELVIEILPSNYQLAMSACKLLIKSSNSVGLTSASVSFWASSLLVNALFQAVPVAAEYMWVEAAGVLHNLTDIRSISESFHKRALSVYPFSLGLWKSYLNLSRITGNTSSVIEAARERGIKLELTL